MSSDAKPVASLSRFESMTLSAWPIMPRCRRDGNCRCWSRLISRDEDFTEGQRRRHRTLWRRSPGLRQETGDSRPHLRSSSLTRRRAESFTSTSKHIHHRGNLSHPRGQWLTPQAVSLALPSTSTLRPTRESHYDVVAIRDAFLPPSLDGFSSTAPEL
jgi:hypothetical protein